jgi:hypothetical protein
MSGDTIHVDFSASSGAVLSECGLYRYQLHRRWMIGRGWAVFIMLNPSTADARIDDPTIRRCMGFARCWGNEGLIVGNLYGFRATDPAALSRASDPVGPRNDDILNEIFAFAQLPNSRVICGWGTNASKSERPFVVTRAIERAGCEPHCLGTTKDGHPRHPLYVSADTQPIPFRRAS